jgi:hypothetical protein
VIAAVTQEGLRCSHAGPDVASFAFRRVSTRRRIASKILTGSFKFQAESETAVKPAQLPFTLH